MSELLLELFSGEIPAMMQPKAVSAYKEIFPKYFAELGIKYDDLEVYIGPRRLTIHVTGMLTKLPESIKEFKGPKVTAPQGAIEGFCRSHNITIEQLVREEVKGTEFFVYKQVIPEQNTRDILLNSLDKPLAEYVWPKSMYWGSYNIKWVRPLQNILCVFDREVIPFKYGHIIANDQCRGNRFMAPEPASVRDFSEYTEHLENNFVVLDASKRKKYIQENINKEANKLGLVIKEDNALLEEVVGLAEYPQVLVGKIEAAFLSLPSEILVSAMRSHQKYFSLFDKNGNFAPYFLFVSNIASTDVDAVISGNEKVLSARLADALYFYNQDLKTSMQEKAERLNKVIFHAKLGNLKEKTLRLASIVKFLDPNNDDLVKAALLCKSDIVSEVVDEFSTLQGIMGYHYAKAESLSDEIAVAIRDHYKPQGSSDHCPTKSAAILALADKMDNLCGLMLAGEKASGSKDPFALRRQALGIIRIILENNLTVDLSKLIAFTVNKYKNNIPINDDFHKNITSFLEERLKYFFKDKYELDAISSVLNLTIESDLVEVQAKLAAIKEFLSSKEGDDLLLAYKRATNILGASKLQGDIDESAFVTEHEKNLLASINSCDVKITDALSAKNYKESLEVLANMLQPIAKFFDNVMVKDQDETIANNRMLLLSKVKQIFDKIAKFNKF
ncbi:MAG: glycine--tRNA ligase subunit beta [Rickettsiaceae bacterium]|nr:glycine--tRNA ligase subunit beta [Rickettsiaceae bacterium]